MAEFDQLFEDAGFLFEMVTEAEFEETMRMINTDIAVETIDWRNASSVAYLRSPSARSTAE